VRVTSTCPYLPPATVLDALTGLPPTDYEVHVVPLRYRERPHMSAWTDFDARRITLQVPEPFLPFGEVVAYGAKRRPGPGMRFIWLTEGITITEPGELLRFLYLHEWMHVHARAVGWRAGETTCDRFALRNYLRDEVGMADAEAARRR